MGHQLNIGVDHDLKEAGGFGGNVWMEWFDFDRKGLKPRNSGDLDEVDYTAYYRYDIKPLATSVKTGWIAETFPKERGNAAWTSEWFGLAAFDDKRLFGTDTCILNPYVAYYQDVNLHPGGWLEWGVSHPFPLAQFGLDKTDILKDITVTPIYLMGIDIHQQTASTNLAKMRYGMEVSYDLSGALKLPAKYGCVSLIGFIYYCQAMADPFKDVLFGGVAISFRL